MNNNLFLSETFFESLSKDQLVRSYYNPEKIFQVLGEERINSRGRKEKLIVATNFEQREYWITSFECNAKSIML